MNALNSQLKDMNKLDKLFRQSFMKEPEHFYMAPSRINLIGEHLDYNGGKVLPASISRYLKAAVSKRDDRKLVFISSNIEGLKTFDMDDIKNDKANGWCNYPLGIFKMLMDAGHKLPYGLNIAYDSDIPMGSGLSSSAAMLDLTALIASNSYGLDLSNKEIALLAFKAETTFSGLKCGIMDQFAIALGKKDKALLLDCTSQEYEYIDSKIDDNYSLVVIVSNVAHDLVSSPYNTRVEECHKGLELLKNEYNINSLCELSVDNMINYEVIIDDDVIFRRVRHVISESDRVNKFINALKNNKVKELGRLLNASHDSLRYDYEVTGEYLDYIHDESLKLGAIGERMIGGGFAGSSIAIIKKDEFNNFSKELTKRYKDKFGIEPDIFLADIVDGIKVVK